MAWISGANPPRCHYPQITGMNPTLAALFPNASQSCKDVNQDTSAPLTPKTNQNEPRVARKPKKHGLMNRTESEYALYLQALKSRGEILRYDFQGLTLRWQCGDDIIRYTPDFVVFVDGYNHTHLLSEDQSKPMSWIIKLIEVKGGYRKMPGYLERAVERFRHARTFWPQFQFELHKKTKEGWKKIL
jgi:hypothetical protein